MNCSRKRWSVRWSVQRFPIDGSPQLRNCPTSTIVSLECHANHCIVGMPCQPFYRWNAISTIVSLECNINRRIVGMPYQPFVSINKKPCPPLYRWNAIPTICIGKWMSHQPSYRWNAISTIALVSLECHINHCTRIVGMSYRLSYCWNAIDHLRPSFSPLPPIILIVAAQIRGHTTGSSPYRHPTTVRGLAFIARRVHPFLPSSTRVQLRLSTHVLYKKLENVSC